MVAPRKTYEFSKPFLDFLFAGILVVVLSPILATVAVFVVATLGRPVIFAQQRLGLHGKPFTIYKFRTMREGGGGADFSDDANRFVPAGRLLRSLSLDELPQLWNVLRGDMSFIGPRPLLVEYLPLSTHEQARRMDVKPGMSGLAQVLGGNSLEWEERFRLDLEYVGSFGPRGDLVILLKTVAVLLRAGRRPRKGGLSSQPFTPRGSAGS